MHVALLLHWRKLQNISHIHGLGLQLFLISQLVVRQCSRYITVSCEPVRSGQLVSVMSSYVYGPDCLGRKPNLLLCCREVVWMRCCVWKRCGENSIYQANPLCHNAGYPQPRSGNEHLNRQSKCGHICQRGTLTTITVQQCASPFLKYI